MVLLFVDAFAVVVAQNAFTWNVPLFTTIATVIQDQYVPILIVWLFLAYAALDRRRFIVTLLTLGMSIVFLHFLKLLFNEPRPCDTRTVASKTCDTESGFPSGHSSSSFSFALASLGTPIHYLFLLFSVVITVSRVYLGAHSILQVAGGWAVAGVAFAVAEQVHDWIYDYTAVHHPHLIHHFGKRRAQANSF